MSSGDASLEVPIGSVPGEQLHAALGGSGGARFDDALRGAVEGWRAERSGWSAPPVWAAALPSCCARRCPAIYDRALAASAVRLTRWISSGDVVVLRHPQTAGLLPALKARRAVVVWRTHKGADCANSLTTATEVGG